MAKKRPFKWGNYIKLDDNHYFVNDSCNHIKLLKMLGGDHDIVTKCVVDAALEYPVIAKVETGDVLAIELNAMFESK